MSQSRCIVSLLSLAIFFANVCCLMHKAPGQVVTRKSELHACCKKTRPSPEQTSHDPSRPCPCCERKVATVDSHAGPHSVTPDLSTWTPLDMIDACMVRLVVSDRPVHALAPPDPIPSLLRQSCALIL